MKKGIVLFMLNFLVISQIHYGQSGNIISQKRISDFSNSRDYIQLLENINGKEKLKPEFQYLNDVDFYNLTYRSDELKINGYIVSPKKEGEYPCIIFNRGGTGDFGRIDERLLLLLLAPLSAEGYVVIASQYRGGGGSEGKDEYGGSDVNDVLNLIPELKYIKNVDSSRIGMYGVSRGGMMTYLALTKTDKIKAAVIWSGIANAYKMIESHSYFENRIYNQLIPNYKENKKVELDKRSAIFWADKIYKKTPILLMHGSADSRVLPDQAIVMASKLLKNKHPFRFVFFEGGDHSLTKHKEERDRIILDWFNDYLKNDKPLPNLSPHEK